MRTAPRPIPPIAWVGLLLGVGIVSALIGLLAGPWGALGGVVLAALPVAFLAWRSAARWRARRMALATPLPEVWRTVLRQWCDHYNRLPDDLRIRFEDDLRIFLAEKPVSGVGTEVTDELRLLVAASAVTLSLGWPSYDWEQLNEVLLYPDDFDRDYEFGADDFSGQAHPWGTVILSVPALCQSFRNPDDAYHVGFHEFAHLLDLEQARFDGIPLGFDDAAARRWVELREREIPRMLCGESVLDEYGAHDPVEFLGVAVEAFFGAALALRRNHGELYELLAAFFRQDPAAWDDARGVTLEPSIRPRPPRRRGYNGRRRPRSRLSGWGGRGRREPR
jgi:Mlc titration factor MtfA (ptsG expression regulator)